MRYDVNQSTMPANAFLPSDRADLHQEALLRLSSTTALLWAGLRRMVTKYQPEQANVVDMLERLSKTFGSVGLGIQALSPEDQELISAKFRTELRNLKLAMSTVHQVVSLLLESKGERLFIKGLDEETLKKTTDPYRALNSEQVASIMGCMVKLVKDYNFAVDKGTAPAPWRTGQAPIVPLAADRAPLVPLAPVNIPEELETLYSAINLTNTLMCELLDGPFPQPAHDCLRTYARMHNVLAGRINVLEDIAGFGTGGALSLMDSLSSGAVSAVEALICLRGGCGDDRKGICTALGNLGEKLEAVDGLNDTMELLVDGLATTPTTH